MYVNFMYILWYICYYGYLSIVSRVVPPDTLPPPVTSSSVVTPVNTPPGSASKGFTKFIQKLLEMGFTSTSAEQALEVVGEDLDKAVHLLTNGEVADKGCTPTKETCSSV